LAYSVCAEADLLIDPAADKKAGLFWCHRDSRQDQRAGLLTQSQQEVDDGSQLSMQRSGKFAIQDSDFG
jgi:hypothetical protein